MSGKRGASAMLDEAESLLSDELRPGDRLDRALTRLLRAQRLIMLAQIELAREAAQ